MLQKKIENCALWGNIVRESWILCIHELKIYLRDKIHYPTGSYLFKVNKGNTRAMPEICSKLKIRTPELCQWRSPRFLIRNFKHISLSISKCLLGTFRYNHIFLWYNYFTIYCDNFKSRSSHRRCSVRKGVLRNFEKFTGKHLC